MTRIEIYAFDATNFLAMSMTQALNMLSRNCKDKSVALPTRIEHDTQGRPARIIWRLERIYEKTGSDFRSQDRVVQTLRFGDTYEFELTTTAALKRRKKVTA